MRAIHPAHASAARTSRGASGPVVTDPTLRPLVREVRACLTDELRKPEYRGNPNPMAGHCYVTSEALYHLLGGKAEGWKPMSIQHEGGPHWFLRRDDGAILDATADQFRTPVPYENGRGCGFLTREPSARTRVVLRRVDHHRGE
jgi:hypothetical protein